MSFASLTAEDVTARLLPHAAALRGAGIRHLSLLGSMAHGEAGLESDIDLVAKLDPAAQFGLSDLVRVEREVGDLLGRKVDVVTEPIRKPRPRTSIERNRPHVF